MGQTQGGSAGNLELLEKIKELENGYKNLKEEKMLPVTSVGNDKSLTHAMNSIIGGNRSMIIIFNNPQDNVFSKYNVNSGFMILFHGVFMWNRHPSFVLFSGAEIYCGTYSVDNNDVTNIFKTILENVSS